MPVKFIVISAKTVAVRRWDWRRFRFVWYRVQRGLTDWHELEIKKRKAPFDIAKVQKSLAARQAAPPTPANIKKGS